MMKRTFLLFALLSTLFVSGYSQHPPQVRQAISMISPHVSGVPPFRLNLWDQPRKLLDQAMNDLRYTAADLMHQGEIDIANMISKVEILVSTLYTRLSKDLDRKLEHIKNESYQILAEVAMMLNSLFENVQAGIFELENTLTSHLAQIVNGTILTGKKKFIKPAISSLSRYNISPKQNGDYTLGITLFAADLNTRVKLEVDTSGKGNWTSVPVRVAQVDRSTWKATIPRNLIEPKFHDFECRILETRIIVEGIKKRRTLFSGPREGITDSVSLGLNLAPRFPFSCKIYAFISSEESTGATEWITHIVSAKGGRSGRMVNFQMSADQGANTMGRFTGDFIYCYGAKRYAWKGHKKPKKRFVEWSHTLSESRKTLNVTCSYRVRASRDVFIKAKVDVTREAVRKVEFKLDTLGLQPGQDPSAGLLREGKYHSTPLGKDYADDFVIEIRPNLYQKTGTGSVIFFPNQLDLDNLAGYEIRVGTAGSVGENKRLWIEVKSSKNLVD